MTAPSRGRIGSLARTVLLAAGLISLGGAAMADPLGLGRPATEAEIAAWDIDVRPDGQGLPEGSGSVFDGEEIFIDQCAVCHGDFGEGAGRWPVLAGGAGSLTSERPVKTVGSYWPYLSTVYDYVHRAMPFGAAQTLSDDEVYALTAYILYLNDLVDDDFELSRENFAEVEMPNAANFYMDDRESSPVFAHRDVCMTDCKATVEITKRAEVLDVTPDDGSEPSGEAAAAEGETETADAGAAEPAPAALDAELVEKGAKVFRKCKACHQVGDGAKHRTGPHLNGMFGRAAGTADGFKKYSDGMTAAGEGGLVWDETTLAEYLEKPSDMIKGTRMSFSGLKKEQDRAAVIEFLKSETAE